MKVLIIHQHFNTPQKGGAIRSYYLAKALLNRGISTVVITAHNEKDYLKAEVDGIEVHYLPVSYDNKYAFAARIISFLKFTVGAARLGEKFRDFDYCYAISVPLTVGVAAIWIKKFYKVPFIFEVGDLWPEAPIQLGFINNAIIQKALYSLEKRIYRSAEAIVALSASIKEHIENKVANKKVYLITNLADCNFFLPETKSPNLQEQLGVKGKFVVTYSGAVGIANGLDYFLECANASRKAELPIHFLLMGEGALRERLMRSAMQLGLSNLSFEDFGNRDRVKQIMNISDASFICYKNVPVLQTGSPNKFFDALAAGKLVVINFGGWIKKEIENNHCGIFVDPQHPTDFIKKIIPFLSDSKMLVHYQMNSRALAEKKYSRELLSKKFVDIFVPRNRDKKAQR